jgi:hypothetical protein
MDIFITNYNNWLHFQHEMQGKHDKVYKPWLLNLNSSIYYKVLTINTKMIVHFDQITWKPYIHALCYTKMMNFCWRKSSNFIFFMPKNMFEHNMLKFIAFQNFIISTCVALLIIKMNIILKFESVWCTFDMQKYFWN